MVDMIMQKLFALGDKLKEEGRDEDRKVVHECERIISECFREAESVAVVVKNKKPKGIEEKYVLSIPDIQVYHDMTDDTYYYELDGMHFDKPAEVIKYLISYREKDKRSIRWETKMEFLRMTHKMIEDMDLTSPQNKIRHINSK